MLHHPWKNYCCITLEILSLLELRMEASIYISSWRQNWAWMKNHISVNIITQSMVNDSSIRWIGSTCMGVIWPKILLKGLSHWMGHELFQNPISTNRCFKLKPTMGKNPNKPSMLFFVRSIYKRGLLDVKLIFVQCLSGVDWTLVA